MTTLGDGLRLAIGTLTLMPIAPPRRTTRPVAAVAMLAAPVAVLPLTAAAVTVLWTGAMLALPPLATATLAVTTLALGSGGLHLDGLADTADGFGVRGAADRRLAVMARGDVGPIGAATLLLVLLLQVAALAELVDGHGPARAALVLGAGVLVSRAVLPVACTRGMKAARPTGLGATVVGSVPRLPAAGVTGLVGGSAFLVTGRPGGGGALLAVATTGVLLVWCRRRLGGVTGDVLGACVEVALTAYLVAAVT